MNETLPFYVAGLGALVAVLPRIKRRLELSRAKHPSLAGHSLWSKRIARLVPGYSYTEAEFFAADGAPPEVQALRRAGLARLSQVLRMRSSRTLALTAELREGLSDLQFTGRKSSPSFVAG